MASFFPVTTTVAGSGRRGFIDGHRTKAAYFDSPLELCVLPDGSVLLADGQNNCLRVVDLRSGAVETVPSHAFLGVRSPVVIDGGQAQGVSPVVVLDTGHNKLRMLQLRRGADGALTVDDCTIAGSGRTALADGAGDSASFSHPCGLVVAGDGSLLVADTGNHAIRRVAARPGKPGLYVTTLVGAGVPGFCDGGIDVGRLCRPTGLVVDAAGTLLIADTGNHAIRALHPPRDGNLGGAWSLTTIAGNGAPGYANGSASEARFREPAGLALSLDGGLLVADAGNNAVRALTATPDGSSRYGRAVTVAGAPPRATAARILPGGVTTTAAAAVLQTSADQGVQRYADGPSVSAARFRRPAALCVLPAELGVGCVLVADSGNHFLRLLVSAAAVAHAAPSGPLTAPCISPALVTLARSTLAASAAAARAVVPAAVVAAAALATPVGDAEEEGWRPEGAGEEGSDALLALQDLYSARGMTSAQLIAAIDAAGAAEAAAADRRGRAVVPKVALPPAPPPTARRRASIVDAPVPQAVAPRAAERGSANGTAGIAAPAGRRAPAADARRTRNYEGATDSSVRRVLEAPDWLVSKRAIQSAFASGEASGGRSRASTLRSVGSTAGDETPLPPGTAALLSLASPDDNATVSHATLASEMLATVNSAVRARAARLQPAGAAPAAYSPKLGLAAAASPAPPGGRPRASIFRLAAGLQAAAGSTPRASALQRSADPLGVGLLAAAALSAPSNGEEDGVSSADPATLLNASAALLSASHVTRPGVASPAQIAALRRAAVLPIMPGDGSARRGRSASNSSRSILAGLASPAVLYGDQIVSQSAALLAYSSRDALAAERRDAGGAVVRALLLADAPANEAAAANVAWAASHGSGGLASSRTTSAPRQLVTAGFVRHTLASSARCRETGIASTMSAPAFVNVPKLVSRKVAELKALAAEVSNELAASGVEDGGEGGAEQGGEGGDVAMLINATIAASPALGATDALLRGQRRVSVSVPALWAGSDLSQRRPSGSAPRSSTAGMASLLGPSAEMLKWRLAASELRNSATLDAGPGTGTVSGTLASVDGCEWPLDTSSSFDASFDVVRALHPSFRRSATTAALKATGFAYDASTASVGEPDASVTNARYAPSGEAQGRGYGRATSLGPPSPVRRSTGKRR